MIAHKTTNPREQGESDDARRDAYYKSVPYFAPDTSRCTECINVLICPFIVMFMIIIQLPVLLFGRRSRRNMKQGTAREPTKERETTNEEEDGPPSYAMQPRIISLRDFSTKKDDKHGGKSSSKSRDLNSIIRSSMERGTPIVMRDAPSSWRKWFRDVSEGKNGAWRSMPTVRKQEGVNKLVITPVYFHSNIMRQMLTNIGRGVCCGTNKVLPAAILLALYLFLAVLVSVTLESFPKIRITCLFFLILFFLMTLVYLASIDDEAWRFLQRRMCCCGSAAGVLGPVNTFIENVIGRDVMYVARFQGYYKAGFAHIDSGSSYNFYYVLKGRKRVQLGTMEECRRLECLYRGVDSCFVPESENDKEAWIRKYFERMYDFTLEPGDVLLFHNSAVVHKFRNLPDAGSDGGEDGLGGKGGAEFRRRGAFADVYSIRLCWDKDIHPMTLWNDLFLPWRPFWSTKKHLHFGRMALSKHIVRITDDI